MGVLGLYSYFETKSLGQRKSWNSITPPASSDTDAPATPLAPSNILSRRRYFILDGNAYIHHLYCGQFEWIWGGQYSGFVNYLVRHITALESAGFRIQVMFDGPLPLSKLQTRLNRDTEKINKLTRVMNDLEHYHALASAATALRVAGEAVTGGGSGVGRSGSSGGGGRSNSQFLIPPLVMEVTLQTLRSLGVEMMVCDGEADGLVAQLAMEKSMDPNVDEAYAVSKDSDYFIYNTGSSSKGGYIPMDSLFVATDPETSITTISATVYSQTAIADHLGIQPVFLPLFATLTGNDYLRPEVFEDQIARALAALTGQKLSGASNTNHARIKATAGFLRQYGAEFKAEHDRSDISNNNNSSGTGSKDEQAAVMEVLDRILGDRQVLYPNEGLEKLTELRNSVEESMRQYALVPDSFSSQESIASESGSSSMINSPRVNTTSSTTATGPSSPPVAMMSLQPTLSALAGMSRITEAFRVGQFSYKLMDVVCNRMFWCTPFLEDTDRESAWLASRELRRWIYGILARNLVMGYERGPLRAEDETVQDVVEYVRRGDHLSAETVTGASREELDEVLDRSVELAKMRALTVAEAGLEGQGSKVARRVSVMDVDVDFGPEFETMDDGGDTRMQEIQGPATLDEASRTSLFLGILGADTAQVRSLPRPFMVLAATLRYLVNALAHSKTRSASISMANFELIALVSSTLFIREIYGTRMIETSPPSSSPSTASIPYSTLAMAKSISSSSVGSTASSSTAGSSSNMSFTSSSLPDEAPPLTKRSLHLSTQFQHALGTVSLLANALHLEEMIPPLSTLFDGLLFQQTLALARGGTSVEQRMQFPESVELYGQILGAIEEGFVETGEIDVVVVFKSNRMTRSLAIFGRDLDPLATPSSTLATLHPATTAAHGSSLTSSSSSTGTLKGSKSSGIHKKSLGSSKKRSGGTGGGSGRSGGGGGGGGRGGSSGGGSGANMFNVLSLGCEF